MVEDNPYGLLGFDGEPMRALRADDDDGVVYLGTFSKTFAAGVRVGWAVAPAAIRDKLILAAESAVLCHSSFSQLTVREYLATQPWLEQIKNFRELYRERRDATLSALDTMMPAGLPLDPAGRRVLRVARAARRGPRQGHAAAGDLVTGRLRAGHRLLRGRLGRPVRPAVLFTAQPGPDPRAPRRAKRLDLDRDHVGPQPADDIEQAGVGRGASSSYPTGRWPPTAVRPVPR